MWPMWNANTVLVDHTLMLKPYGRNLWWALCGLASYVEGLGQLGSLHLCVQLASNTKAVNFNVSFFHFVLECHPWWICHHYCREGVDHNRKRVSNTADVLTGDGLKDKSKMNYLYFRGGVNLWIASSILVAFIKQCTYTSFYPIVPLSIESPKGIYSMTGNILYWIDCWKSVSVPWTTHCFNIGYLWCCLSPELFTVWPR